MKVPLKILHTVGCASRDAGWWQLTSVYLEKSETRRSATATDGKQLLHVTWKDKDAATTEFSGILSADSVKKILKMRDGTEAVEIPETIGPDSGTTGTLRGEASLLPGEDKVTVEGIDATYPDYSSVMPRGHNFEIRVNPAILVNMLQTMMKVLGETKKHCGTVVIRLQDEEHPISIEGTKDGVTAHGLVMPVVKLMGAVLDQEEE